MPKSRARKNKKRHGSKAVRAQQQRAARTMTSREHADLRLLQATDEAEARGDVRGALELMKDDLRTRDDDNFWRPEKIERLVQLDVLGPALPRWATSRWILAQAAQWLDEDNRARMGAAFSVAFRAGGFVASRYRDEFDLRMKILDHNWVFRQAFLYDLGGLKHFLDDVASADLVAGADSIADWVATPLSGFLLLEETRRTLHWLDLRAGVKVQTPNIGSATLLVQGDCAVGRLQPVQEGWIFDAAPMYVPPRVAQQIAEEPAGWVAALEEADNEVVGEGRGVATNGYDFQLLTDVPRVIQHLLLVDVEETVYERGLDVSTADPRTLEVGLLRAALDGRLGDDVRGLSPWPTVAGVVLQPSVLERVLTSARAGDAVRLRRVARQLAQPAASLCRDLAAALAEAA